MNTLAGALLCVVSFAAPATAQTTWHVDVNGTPPGTGTPTDPYTSIQYAIAQPSTVGGDTVSIAPGVYFENLDFLGKAITVSGSGQGQTIVDGSLANPVVRFTSGEGAGSVLRALTLRKGQGENSVPGQWRGGGVYAVGASPTIRLVTVESCRGTHGAGMYLDGSQARVEDCLVRENEYVSYTLPWPHGGGIWSSGSIRVLRTVIRDNKDCAQGGGVWGRGEYVECEIRGNAARGAGAYAPNPNALTFVRCQFIGNFAHSEGTPIPGGGIFGPATAIDCTFSGNHASEGAAAVGATLVGCTLVGNSANPLGGAATGCTLLDCDVIGNTSTGGGGGLRGGSATRCRIVGNSAAHGGGAYSPSSLVHCTLEGNTATGPGGNIAVTGGSVTVSSSIVRNGGPQNIAMLSGGPLTVHHSDVEGGWPGTGNFDADPLYVNAAANDYHLLPGSPCIDAGDPLAPPDPDGSVADVGAYAWIPGYCGAIATECAGKVNSLGCIPQIDSTGYLSLSGADDFVLSATGVLNEKMGLMFWGVAGASTPLLGGTLCVAPPLTRTDATFSGGSQPPVADCSGTHVFAFTHAYVAAQGIPPGQTIHAQFFSRDPAHPDGTGASLSNALRFTVCP